MQKQRWALRTADRSHKSPRGSGDGDRNCTYTTVPPYREIAAESWDAPVTRFEERRMFQRAPKRFAAFVGTPGGVLMRGALVEFRQIAAIRRHRMLLPWYTKRPRSAARGAEQGRGAACGLCGMPLRRLEAVRLLHSALTICPLSLPPARGRRWTSCAAGSSRPLPPPSTPPSGRPGPALVRRGLKCRPWIKFPRTGPCSSQMIFAGSGWQCCTGSHRRLRVSKHKKLASASAPQHARGQSPWVFVFDRPCRATGKSREVTWRLAAAHRRPDRRVELLSSWACLPGSLQCRV